MDETSTMQAQRHRVAGALTLAGVALAPGRDAAIAAQLTGTIAACAPLRDALRFTDDPDSVHAPPSGGEGSEADGGPAGAGASPGSGT